MIFLGICDSIDSFMPLQLIDSVLKRGRTSSVLILNQLELRWESPFSSAFFSSYHCPKPEDMIYLFSVYKISCLGRCRVTQETLSYCERPVILFVRRVVFVTCCHCVECRVKSFQEHLTGINQIVESSELGRILITGTTYSGIIIPFY